MVVALGTETMRKRPLKLCVELTLEISTVCPGAKPWATLVAAVTRFEPREIDWSSQRPTRTPGGSGLFESRMMQFVDFLPVVVVLPARTRGEEPISISVPTTI